MMWRQNMALLLVAIYLWYCITQNGSANQKKQPLFSKAKSKNIDIPQSALEYIASAIKSNIRELEGALNIVYAKTRLLGKNPSINDIKDIFNKNIYQPRKNVTFNKIIKTISVYYEIEEKRIFEKTGRNEQKDFRCFE